MVLTELIGERGTGAITLLGLSFLFVISACTALGNRVLACGGRGLVCGLSGGLGEQLG